MMIQKVEGFYSEGRVQQETITRVLSIWSMGNYTFTNLRRRQYHLIDQA